MKKRFIFPLIFGLLLACLLVQPVSADGIIIPDPTNIPADIIIDPMSQLIIRYHHVTVKIVDQIAITNIDQVFYNPNDWAVEGIYIFPLPVDAVVNDFVLWMDGEPVHGEVLDAEQARQKYEEIVATLRDPALLEYIGQGCVQANIFPIPAGGESRIELEYSQVLTADNGLVRYVYPLNTEKFSLEPLESVSITLEVSSGQPIRAIYSPSHTIDANRPDDRHFTASYEDSYVTPDADFVLYYSLGETEAFHLFTYRDPQDAQDEDGFFMLLLAPSPGDDVNDIPKDMILVLDRSGSMDGEKFQQAQAAARYILSHLNSNDRFYLVSFSSSIDTLANHLLPASEAETGLAWVDEMSAAGSTDINRALLEAAAVIDSERPTYLIFLTDGLPTEGVTDAVQILDNFAEEAPSNLRLFSFGVGYDVDTYLLDSLSQGHHGLSTYVRPGEALDEILSGFYARISTPVLTDLALDFDGLATYDLYPQPLPDLFAGSQIVVVGRYKGGGVQDVALTGTVNSAAKHFLFEGLNFPEHNSGEDSSLPGLPRLWATRKIGFLLNKIRLEGADEETVDQIVRLSIRYGIVTPYTSYLVTEPNALGAANQEELSQDAFQAIQAAPTMVSGQAAVEKADEENELREAGVAPSLDSETQERVRVVGSSSFVLADGVWIDTRYDPATMQTWKIEFLSNEYFDFVLEHPEAGDVLALGERVIFKLGDEFVEVTAGTSPETTRTPGSSAETKTPKSATPTPDSEAGTTPTAQNVTATPRSTFPPATGTALAEEPQVETGSFLQFLPWILLGIAAVGAGLWALGTRPDKG